jgi:hypothetical protein
MFKYNLLLIFLYTFSSYGQQYDTIKNQTIKIDYSDNKLMLPGKWIDIKNKKKSEDFVTHCPILINEDKTTLLEFGLWDITYVNFIKHNNIEDLHKSTLEYFRRSHIAIYNMEINKEMNFTYYKLIVNSKKYPNKSITIHLLNGIKISRFIYSIAVYSYDKEIENPRDFLINLYYTN